MAQKRPETPGGKQYMRDLIFVACAAMRTHDRIVRADDPLLDKLTALHYVEAILEEAERAVYQE